TERWVRPCNYLLPTKGNTDEKARCHSGVVQPYGVRIHYARHIAGYWDLIKSIRRRRRDRQWSGERADPVYREALPRRQSHREDLDGRIPAGRTDVDEVSLRMGVGQPGVRRDHWLGGRRNDRWALQPQPAAIAGGAGETRRFGCADQRWHLRRSCQAGRSGLASDWTTAALERDGGRSVDHPLIEAPARTLRFAGASFRNRGRLPAPDPCGLRRHARRFHQAPRSPQSPDHAPVAAALEWAMRGPHSTAVAQYRPTRLRFRRDVIEPLAPDERF